MKLDELQNKLFDMLCMFDSICTQHGITYFLDSGTALGAVREHDFIPWDDDIDVAMMRPEYERLRVILKNELPEKYKLIEPRDYAPYFFDFIPKLIDTTVPLREETEEDRAYKNYQNRMSIDFVLLDTVPDGKLRQKLIITKCKLYYGLARSKRYKNHPEKLSLAERALSGTCSLIGKFLTYGKIMDLYEKNTKKYHGKKSNSVIRSNTLLYFIKCYEKASYESAVMLPFHGKCFPVPSEYDKVLTRMYGDYMTPRRDYKGFVSHT